jgi:hypothetical protein
MNEIVVGVDESAWAATALRWATEEGELRHLPVTAVLAWSYLEQHHVGGRRFDAAYGEDDAAPPSMASWRTSRAGGAAGHRAGGRLRPGCAGAGAARRRRRPARRRSSRARRLPGPAAGVGQPAVPPPLAVPRRGRPASRPAGRAAPGSTSSPGSTGPRPPSTPFGGRPARPGSGGAQLVVVHAYLLPGVAAFGGGEGALPWARRCCKRRRPPPMPPWTPWTRAASWSTTAGSWPTEPHRHCWPPRRTPTWWSWGPVATGASPACCSGPSART